MRMRDHGRPRSTYHEFIFNAWAILDRFGIGVRDGEGSSGNRFVVAEAIGDVLHAFEFEGFALDCCNDRRQSLPVVWEHCDVMSRGFGVTAGASLLFNIQHSANPIALLRHAAAAAELILVIARNTTEASNDCSRDRRRFSDQVIEWGTKSKLQLTGDIVDLPPWHFGIMLVRSA